MAVIQEIQQSEQQTLFSLQEMTVLTTRSIEKVKQDIKSANEMLHDAHANSTEYRMKEEEVKEKKKDLLSVQNTIDQAPDISGLKSRLKELRDELKEKKVSVSEYALEVNRIGGITDIEVDGQTYEIVKSAKLVKKPKFKEA